MNLSNIKSVDKATDRELLLMIISMQFQLARRIEFLEAKVSESDFGSPEELSIDIVRVCCFPSRINTILSLS